MIATKAEIDAWVKARPVRDRFSLRLSALENGGNLLALQVAQLTRLRKDAARLHAEVVASREALWRSIEQLHKSLRVPLVEEDPRLYSGRRPTADLLAFDSKKKVN